MTAASTFVADVVSNGIELDLFAPSGRIDHVTFAAADCVGRQTHIVFRGKNGNNYTSRVQGEGLAEEPAHGLLHQWQVHEAPLHALGHPAQGHAAFRRAHHDADRAGHRCGRRHQVQGIDDQGLLHSLSWVITCSICRLG